MLKRALQDYILLSRPKMRGQNFPELPVYFSILSDGFCCMYCNPSCHFRSYLSRLLLLSKCEFSYYRMNFSCVTLKFNEFDSLILRSHIVAKCCMRFREYQFINPLIERLVNFF